MARDFSTALQKRHTRRASGVFDGLPGLVEAFKTVYPKANVQRCVVYIVRNTLSCVRKKGQFEVAEDLKLIYCTKKGNSVTDVSA